VVDFKEETLEKDDMVENDAKEVVQVVNFEKEECFEVEDMIDNDAE
jgi:uncharacterized protein YkuJ